MNRMTAVVAGLSLAFVGTSATYAATHTVCPSGCDYTTIQAAIDASAHGDVINIHAGTYHEHSVDPHGKAITIQGTRNSDGSLATTIDAQQGGSVFTFQTGETSGTVIKDLVITGGSDVDGAGAGSGIVCYYSSPTITGCTISGNHSIAGGGGIFCGEQSSPTITACTISGNTATQGGGIYCYNNSPTISGCTITNNTAANDDYKPSDLGGGGIYCSGSSPTISNCTISGNNSNGTGGGINCHSSHPTITGCTISGNTAINDGVGGIYCDGSSSPTLNYTVICGNTGGQVACESGTACYTNNGSGISDDCGTSSVIVAMALQMQHLTEVVNNQQSAIHDLQQVVEACCSSKCAADHDNNGHIDVEDLLHIMATWGPCAQ